MLSILAVGVLTVLPLGIKQRYSPSLSLPFPPWPWLVLCLPESSKGRPQESLTPTHSQSSDDSELRGSSIPLPTWILLFDKPSPLFQSLLEIPFQKRCIQVIHLNYFLKHFCLWCTTWKLTYFYLNSPFNTVYGSPRSLTTIQNPSKTKYCFYFLWKEIRCNTYA